MNHKLKSIFFRTLVAASLFFTAFGYVSANDNQAYSFVAEKLSSKIRTDLAQSNASVQLTKVRKSEISKNKTTVEGDAVCLCDAENARMPIHFKADIDAAKRLVTDIEYDFVESSTAFEPKSNEEVLMQELMKQISRDFKTENIVIAIDNYEDVSIVTYNKNEYTGVGEVRIGDFVWKKIKFDVVLNPKNRLTSKIVYNLEK